MSDIQLIHGDCLEVIPTLEPGSIDAIITDLPYGMTACKWDTFIPFDDLWRVVKHVLKPRGAFVTTASQPFTSALVMSNPGWFRYELIWDKKLPTGYLDANRKPLKRHENIIIFSQNGHAYNPQKETRGKPRWKGGENKYGAGDTIYHAHTQKKSYNNEYYPASIITVSNAAREAGRHPTQKPVALFEYLIRTYTNPGELVLDMCAGSFTTAVACINAGRRFIGIEKEREYYEIGLERVRKAQEQMRLNI